MSKLTPDASPTQLQLRPGERICVPDPRAVEERVGGDTRAVYGGKPHASADFGTGGFACPTSANIRAWYRRVALSQIEPPIEQMPGTIVHRGKSHRRLADKSRRADVVTRFGKIC